MTPGLLIFTILFIVAFLTLTVLAYQYPDHWLARTVRIGWGILAPILIVGWATMGTISFIKRRRQERRDRAERDAGLM